ncbi:YcaO-like family protein [Ichthyobacterium seriolicida]|uniref:YcaO-like family protein n=1 Tax=Ichthyobacterium seriolicida TaxID=242600 RepID=UPI0012FE0219|nr:YcaO-like family protein [Ichthyobacterium seriolicida]
MISEEIGIIKNIYRSANIFGDPKVISYSSTNCDVEKLTDNNSFFCGNSGGAGIKWEDAFLACIGETVERYCSCFYDKKSMIKSTYLDINDNAIHPSNFSLFHQKQYNTPKFPFIPFTETTEVFFDRAYDLTTENVILCPATFLYMPFLEDSVRISENISTGFASHTDYHKAILSASYEIVERDSFSIWWMNLLDLPKIKIEGEVRKLIEEIIPDHLTIHLFDMTTDVKIPSVFGILEGINDKENFIAFSAATRYTFYDAIKKTIIECCQSVPYTRFLIDRYNNYDFNDFNSVKSFEAHSVFYNKRKDLRYIIKPFLEKTPNKTVNLLKKDDDFSDKIKLSHLVSIFKQKKYPYIVKEITTNDIKNYGFVVVRVIIPNMTHLNGTYGQYYLGGDRLYESPKKMGYDTKKIEELNTFPHPFP